MNFNHSSLIVISVGNVKRGAIYVQIMLPADYGINGMAGWIKRITLHRYQHAAGIVEAHPETTAGGYGVTIAERTIRQPDGYLRTVMIIGRLGALY